MCICVYMCKICVYIEYTNICVKCRCETPMYAECVCVCPIYLYGECVRVRVFGTSGVCQPCVSGQQAGCAARGDRDQAPRLHLCCPGPQSPALWSAAVTSLLASLLLGPLPAHSPLSALGRRHPVRV